MTIKRYFNERVEREVRQNNYPSSLAKRYAVTDEARDSAISALSGLINVGWLKKKLYFGIEDNKHRGLEIRLFRLSDRENICQVMVDEAGKVRVFITNDKTSTIATLSTPDDYKEYKNIIREKLN